MYNWNTGNTELCRSLRIAGRSAQGSSDTVGKSSNTERDITAPSATDLKERSAGEPVTYSSSREPSTLAEAGARLADSVKSATVADTSAGYRSRARYLLELDHHVGEDLLESVLGLLRDHGLSCDVAGGSDGDRYILVTAPFEVLAAQVCVGSSSNEWMIGCIFCEFQVLTVEVSLHGRIPGVWERKGPRCFINFVNLFANYSCWLNAEYFCKAPLKH